jgi:hypothetical protein
MKTERSIFVSQLKFLATVLNSSMFFTSAKLFFKVRVGSFNLT